MVKNHVSNSLDLDEEDIPPAMVIHDVEQAGQNDKLGVEVPEVASQWNAMKLNGVQQQQKGNLGGLQLARDGSREILQEANAAIDQCKNQNGGWVKVSGIHRIVGKKIGRFS